MEDLAEKTVQFDLSCLMLKVNERKRGRPILFDRRSLPPLVLNLNKIWVHKGNLMTVQKPVKITIPIGKIRQSDSFNWTFRWR